MAGARVRNLGLRRTAAVVSVVMTASALVAQTPAFAAAKATSHVKATAVPGTVRVGGTVEVTGAVSPKVATSVVLERFVGKTWTTVGHGKTSKTGVYVLSLHAPKTAASVIVRVTEAATTTTKAATSGTLHLHVVKTGFTVTATHAATGQTLAVTGKVSPKGKGSVSLDRDVKGIWLSLGKAALTPSSTYSFSKTLAAGSYKLRVSKPFSTTVAGGVSPAFTDVVTVAAPTPTPTTPAVVLPVVTATSLTSVVGIAFRQVLTATSGTAPYTWSVVSGSLPTGLVLSTAGVVSGTPLTPQSFSLTVSATDALGHAGTAVVSAAVRPVTLRAWGDNDDDTFGDGSGVSGTYAITTATGLATARTVVGGNGYTLALQTDGTVWAWGDTVYGQLGLGSQTSAIVPVQVPGLSSVVSIAAGTKASYAVTSTGQVYAWGDNAVGELGQHVTSTTPTMSPTLVSGVPAMASIAAGDGFVLALTTDGRVFAWGNGTDGTLGDNTNTGAQPTPAAIAGITTAVQVSATTTAGYALLADGTARSWGLADHGQLGHNDAGAPPTYHLTPVTVDGLTNATSIACTGVKFCLARLSDGTVDAWGDNSTGQMGLGYLSVPNDNLVPEPILGLTNVASVATAAQTGFALHTDGTVSAWGGNLHGVLGNGDMTDASQFSPVPLTGLTGIVAIAAGQANGYATQAS